MSELGPDTPRPETEGCVAVNNSRMG